jgi:N-acetylglutamate synthase
MRRRSDTVRAYRDAFAERDRIYELDTLGARAWPALTVLDLDGWRLRTSGGFTRRANSVWPRAFGDRLDLATKLANVERHYAARGLPTVFQVGPAAQPKGLDRALAARGYRASAPVEVRTARLADLPGAAGPPPARVTLAGELSPCWLETWAWAGARPPEAVDVARRILTRVAAPGGVAGGAAAGGGGGLEGGRGRRRRE